MSSYVSFLILLEFTFNGECFPIPNNEITEEWYSEAAIQYPLNSWKTLQVQIIAPNTEAAEKTTQSPVVQSPGVAYPLDTGEILQLRIISPNYKEQVDLTDTDAEDKTNETTFTESTENAIKKKYIIIKILNNNAPMDLESKYDEALSIFSRILNMERELHAELFHEHENLLNTQPKSDVNVHVTNQDDPWKELADIFHKIGSDLEHKQDANLQNRIEGYTTPNEERYLNTEMNKEEDNLKHLLEKHLSLGISALGHKENSETQSEQVTKQSEVIQSSTSIMNRYNKLLEQLLETQLAHGISALNDKEENEKFSPGSITESRYLNTEMNKEEDNLKHLLEKHLSLGISALGHKENSETQSEQVTKQSEVIQSSTSIMNRYNKLLEQLLETQLAHGISALNDKEENEKFSPGSITESRYLNTEMNKEEDNLKHLLEKHLSLGISALGHKENSETQSEQVTKQSEVIQSSTSIMNRYNKLLEQLLETQLAHGISALNDKEENEKFSPGSITESSSLKTDGHQLLHDHDVNIRIEAPPPLKISTDTEHRLNLIGDTQISHVAVRKAKALDSENSTEKSTVVTAETLAELEKYQRFVKKGADFLLYMWNKLYPKTQNISLEKPWESEKFRRFTKRGGDLLIYTWSKLPTKGRSALEIH